MSSCTFGIGERSVPAWHSCNTRASDWVPGGGSWGVDDGFAGQSGVVPAPVVRTGCLSVAHGRRS